MAIINAAMITVFIPGQGVARFAPQPLTTDPTQPAGAIAFGLTCDPAILQGANSTVTVVPSVGDPMYITNICVNENHYGDGTHQIIGDVTSS